jgi:hypothetical protein
MEKYSANLINRIEARLLRKITDTERHIIASAICNSYPACTRIPNQGELVDIFANKLNNNMTNMQEYMLSELKTPDGRERNMRVPDREEFAKMISSRLDRNLLLPQFGSQYIALDSYFSNYNGAAARYLNFPMAANNNAANNYTINLKYPIENVIRVEIQNFTLPQYLVGVSSAGSAPSIAATVGFQKSPPAQLINITMRELVETTKTSPIFNYNFLCRCEWSETKYDGINMVNLSKVTPINAVQTFKFPLKYLTNVTVQFNDMFHDMWMPSPIILSDTLTYANPTIITLNGGVNVSSTELVYISDFKSDNPALDILMNSAAGYLATYINETTLSLALDTSAFAAASQPIHSFNISIPSRRIVIPMVITQLRPEVVDDISF